MKLTDIEFEDDAFKACVLATGMENAEDVIELRCRKQGIESAAGIEHLTNLKLLDLTRNEISKLDLSKNTKLEEAFLGNNELKSLDISGCSALTHLAVFINELDELVETGFGGAEARTVGELVDKVALKEHETDVSQRELLRSLLAHETAITYGDFFLWSRIIRQVANIADRSENLAVEVRTTLDVS